MRYFPLIRAGLGCRPLNASLTFVSVTIAFLLAGLAIGFARLLPGGNTPMMAAGGVVALGFAMILFLTGNAVAQTVRLRLKEFAILKSLGFPTRLILALVFAETAAACLAGAFAGLLLAEALAAPFLSLLPHAIAAPRPFVPPLVYALSLAAAVALTAISTMIPALRIARLDAAAALRGSAA
jgi:putative ABC transport system permease protein